MKAKQRADLLQQDLRIPATWITEEREFTEWYVQIKDPVQCLSNDSGSVVILLPAGHPVYQSGMDVDFGSDEEELYIVSSIDLDFPE